MSIITLIRHGQASAGTHDYDRLSELGKQQAGHLGQWWSKTGKQPSVSFAGSMKRQQHTGELALGSAGLKVHLETLPQLNEYAHTDIDERFAEGLSSDGGTELTLPDYIGIMRRWSNASDSELRGAESWRDFVSRSVEAVHTASEAVGQRRHAFLFTSGGVIASILGSAQSHPFDVVIGNIWNIRNASTTTLLVTDKTIEVLDFNAVPHLDWHNDSNLITQI